MTISEVPAHLRDMVLSMLTVSLYKKAAHIASLPDRNARFQAIQSEPASIREYVESEARRIFTLRNR